jgi:hypothetical protein
MRLTRHARILILLVLVLLLLACGSATEIAPTAAPTATLAPSATPEPTLTPTLEVVNAVPASNTNCRSGPSTDYPVMVSIPAGTEVKVLGRNSGSDYFFVENPQSPGSGCWVKGSLVTVIGTVAILPVFTPPAIIYPTAAAQPTVSCDINGTISIINNTGGNVTLYLSGPAKFTFRVSTGNQSVSVCAGTYSYTAYGCGGASRTGTASPGDEIEFWCE